MIRLHAFQMQGEGLLGQAAGVIEVDARRNATRKVGERHAVVAVGVLVDERYEITRQRSPQFDPGLLLDAFQRPKRQVALRMRDSDAPWLGRVLELDVAALLGDLLPAVRFQSPENVPAVHALIRYTLMRIVQDVLRLSDVLQRLSRPKVRNAKPPHASHVNRVA